MRARKIIEKLDRIEKAFAELRAENERLRESRENCLNNWTLAAQELKEYEDKCHALRAENYEKLKQLWDAINPPTGSICRDCADHDGRCPHSGLPCTPQDAALETVAKLRAEVERLKGGE